MNICLYNTARLRARTLYVCKCCCKKSELAAFLPIITANRVDSAVRERRDEVLVGGLEVVEVSLRTRRLQVAKHSLGVRTFGTLGHANQLRHRIVYDEVRSQVKEQIKELP